MAITAYNQAIGAYNNAKQVANGARRTDMGAQDEGIGAPAKPAFSELVGEALNQATNAGYKSEAASMSAITGDTSVEDLISAVTNAEMALNTVVAIRDKVISSYQEIIKMPI